MQMYDVCVLPLFAIAISTDWVNKSLYLPWSVLLYNRRLVYAFVSYQGILDLYLLHRAHSSDTFKFG